MNREKNLVYDRIIDAALAEFLACGYRQASMRAIAARAGMTVGNVYLYFRGKAGLFSAALEPAMADIERLLVYKWQAKEAVSHEDLADFAESICQIFLKHQQPFLILLNGSEGSPMAHYRTHLYQAAQSRLEDALATSNSPSAGDAPLIQALTAALIEGLICLLVHYTNDPQTLRQAVGRFLTSILGVLFPTIV